MTASKLITLHASAARTASGNGTATNLDNGGRAMRAELNVTAENDAATGETLDVVIEDSIDGTNWNLIGTFAQKTDVGREVINIQTPFFPTVRCRWTIGGSGSPSFTFTVKAHAIVE